MTLLFSILIIAAVFSAKISSRLGVPVLIAFIGLGVLVGSDVLNLFYFDDAMLARRIADMLLVFILFVGGFQTRSASLRAVAGPALTLATLGVAMTAGLLGLLVHLVTGFSLVYSLMIASIISSTDAAAMLMITQANPVRSRTATTLEVESAANDPMAIILTLTFVEVVAGHVGSPLVIALELLWQFAGGISVGFIMSRLSRFLFNHLNSENRGYYYVLAIGTILLAYSLAGLMRANGIIAVFFMGHWLGNSTFSGKRSVSNFLEGISTAGNVALFLMLGLLAFPRNFVHIWKEGLIIAALTMFVVRPVVVLLSTLPWKYAFRERLFIMWGGIKGAVPIVLATYPAAWGLDPDGTVFNIIFFAVLVSCLVQGLSMGPLARALRLTVPPKPVPPHSIELFSSKHSDMEMFEVHVEPGASCAGLSIRELALPDNVLISSMVRGEHLVPPKGSTVIQEGDILFVLGPASLAAPVSTGLNAPQSRLSTTLPELPDSMASKPC